MRVLDIIDSEKTKEIKYRFDDCEFYKILSYKDDKSRQQRIWWALAYAIEETLKHLGVHTNAYDETFKVYNNDGLKVEFNLPENLDIGNVENHYYDMLDEVMQAYFGCPNLSVKVIRKQPKVIKFALPDLILAHQA